MFTVMYPWWASQHQNQRKLLQLSRCSAGDKLTSLQTSACGPAPASWRWGSRPRCPWSPRSTCWCRCRAPSGRRGCRTPRCGKWRAAAYKRWAPDPRPESNVNILSSSWWYFHCIFYPLLSCNWRRLSKYCPRLTKRLIEPLGSSVFGVEITNSKYIECN